jgi:ribosome recycling factor
LIKLIGKLAEDGRVALRHERRHGLEALKKEQKDGKITEDELSLGEKEIQKLTDQYTGKIETLVTTKEAELLKV